MEITWFKSRSWQHQYVYYSFSLHKFVACTCCFNALAGRLSVSVKWRFFGRRGLEEGVCMAKHRMKHAMKITKAIPMRRTAHQNSVTHCAIVSRVFSLSKRFLSLTKGPSASTLRHLRNTSQYPWNSSGMVTTRMNIKGIIYKTGLILWTCFRQSEFLVLQKPWVFT